MTNTRPLVPPAPSVPAVPGACDRREDWLRNREAEENFAVALALLPRRLREHLRAVYDVVRVIDELGDSAPGDRSAALSDFREELARVWADAEPAPAVLTRLGPTVRACRLPRDPFDELVRANLQDQQVCDYAEYRDLLDYCALSAAPIGRLVLAVFGVTGGAELAWSDRICTALQLLEHWQDVAEDRRTGRIYLPREDMARYGVRPEDLDADVAGPQLRRLIGFQTERARLLLESGSPLTGALHGWARLAVCGYLAGGYAAVDALRRCGGDVLGGDTGVRRVDQLRHLVTTYGRAGR